jgi:hypothetical protein
MYGFMAWDLVKQQIAELQRTADHARLVREARPGRRQKEGR